MSGTDLAEPAKTFELTITTMDFVRRDVIAPGDMLLKDVLQEFAEAMSRPGLAADGEMIVRHLYDKETGRDCDLTQTVSVICSQREKVNLFLTRPSIAG